MSILKEAEAKVEERARNYGHPAINFEIIRQMWSAYLGRQLSIRDVAMLMVLLKVARIPFGNGIVDDTLLDIAGYIHALDMSRCRVEPYKALELNPEHIAETGVWHEPRA